jgi:hypothetical protein
MKTARHCLLQALLPLWGLLGIGWVDAAGAATFQVDDSRSVVLNTNLPMQWRSLSPASGDHWVLGVTRVQTKLDTRPWAGQFGKIFMTLPAQPSGQVQVRWETQGPFVSGQLVSGQRGLVWSGTMPAGLLEDLMTVTIQTDGRLLSATQLLRFNFEVDLP